MVKKIKNVYPYPDVSDKNYKLIKAGIKVYPNAENGKFKIHVNNNGNLTIFKKEIPQKEVNEAINKTISFMYDKLVENGKNKN